MKNLLIIFATVLIVTWIWTRQHAHRHVVALQNKRLEAAARELNARAEQAETARQSAEQRLAGLREDVRTTEAALAHVSEDSTPASMPPAEPDPSRYGGWPQGSSFFYLPKEYLTNMSYRLLDEGRLTDEAAVLLGMSGTEREAVNELFSNLLARFRQLEIERMKPIDPPAQWGVGQGQKKGWATQFDAALTYRIPGLAADTEAARQAFSQQLQQTLGSSRAQLIEPAASSYLRQNLDDLGGGERIVGFLWSRENDGTHSLWYGAAGDIHGPGTFNPVELALKPNSPLGYLAPQINYYARLFGVRLPGQP